MSHKLVIMGSLFLTSALFLSGCDMGETIDNVKEDTADKIAGISIPFEWFRDDPDNIKEVTIPEVKGLNVAEEKVDVDSLLAFRDRTIEIGERLKEEKNFQAILDGKKEIFNILGSEYMSLKYGEQGDAFTKTIQEIGEVEYQSVNSLTLRQYGIKLSATGDRQTVAVVDVNAVNDTEDFHIHTLQLALDENQNIISSTQVGNPIDKPHTVTPLTEDSLLYEDTHQEFEHYLGKVIQALSNPTLYAQIEAEEITPTDTTIQALTKQIGIESKNTTTVYSLLQDGKGTFKEWGITGYLFDDKDVTAKTFYELTVADEDGKHVYTIHYDRGKKEITNISKGSPFKEVQA